MSEGRAVELQARTAGVAARLSATPGVQHVPAVGIDLWVRQVFLYEEERRGLVELIAANLRPSTILSDRPDPGFRTSTSCDLDRWHPLVRRIDTRIAGLLGLDERQGETLQGQRYEVGQEFKAHHDGFAEGAPYWPEHAMRGGQRTWTAMLYLEAPTAGGGTWFPRGGIRVDPRVGMLLAWNNRDADGGLAPAALHAGTAVEAGRKTIVTKWFREGDWC